MGSVLDVHEQLRVAYLDHRPAQEVDRILNSCPDMECSICAEILCPYQDSLHFHHDGCPSCSEPNHY